MTDNGLVTEARTDGYSLGVDLGTTFVAAAISRNSQPEMIALGDRSVVSPSVVYAYVTNRAAGSVSVIDTATNAVTETVPVNRFPSGVAVTPDGRHVYVTNVGSGTVSVLDTATNAISATLPVGASPTDVAISPDGHSAYVADRDSGTVAVIHTG
jgi:YVTN family beta-propeller protein